MDNGGLMVITRATVPKPLLSIILPTFNESKNVAGLLLEISKALHGVAYEYECIFVDDSRDDTVAVIMRESLQYMPRVTVIKRHGEEAKTGLTRAFRRGFEEARGAIIVCMDTDLQHPPGLIPELVEVAGQKWVDVAVASRYTYGGSAEGLDGVFRHLVSRVTNRFVHFLLPGTRTTSDPMTGFFAFRRELLRQVSFSSYGFKILVEILSTLTKPRVIDVPFTFQKRGQDVSKATLKQGYVAYRDSLRLFFTGGRGDHYARSLVLAVVLTIGSGLYQTVAATVGAMNWSEISSSGLFGVGFALNSQLTELLPVMSAVFGAWDVTWFGFGILLGLTLLSVINIFRWMEPAIYVGRTRPRDLLLAGLYIVFTLFCYRYFAAVFDAANHWSLSLILGGSALLVFLAFGSLWRQDWRRLFALERWLFVVMLMFLFIITFFFGKEFSIWSFLMLGLYVLIIAQGLFAIYLMIYHWEDPSRRSPLLKPADWWPPRYSFTAIVPCKHEKHTIADTIRAMHRINYPDELKEILVVIHEGTDDGTIGVVKQTIGELGKTTVRLVTYNVDPVNKPHGLNAALAEATGDFVTIFDAEDEPHPDLFKVINTHLCKEDVDVVQSGVQLMNFNSNWYSTFNVLEYYFWFKSSLHFFARQGVVPLGGVSVFFRRSYLDRLGGWDLTCLTEDAEIGIRLSQAGARTKVVYDAVYATKEETPPNLLSFIKQRTRWAQGFLQILARGRYWYFPTYRQRLLALYVLSWPLIIPLVFLMLPIGLLLMVYVSLPPFLAILTNISFLLFLAFLIVQILGLYEFTRDYRIKFPWRRVLVIIAGFYFYTFLLVAASLRAIYRQMVKINVWEKTEHLNVHRQGARPVDGTVGLGEVPSPSSAGGVN